MFCLNDALTCVSHIGFYPRWLLHQLGTVLLCTVHNIVHLTNIHCSKHWTVLFSFPFPFPLLVQQSSCLKDDGPLTNYFCLRSQIFHVSLSCRPLFRGDPFLCISLASYPQALLALIVERTFICPCPVTGFSYLPTYHHKQVFAVFVHTERCIIQYSKCVYEPHKCLVLDEVWAFILF